MSFFVSPQSSFTLQDVCDIVSANGDTAPALAAGGFSQLPALAIANRVMAAMLLGGPNGQPFNHKFNRFLVPAFSTISWQQDYFIPNLVTLGWIESCYAIQFQNTSQPKPKMAIEVHRDLLVTYQQMGWPAKICWIPNNIALTGTWGATELQTQTGQNNPGPNVVYTNPLSTPTQPANPITQIKDPNGNLWVLTTYGTCGSTQPTWPTSPAYPTLTSPNTTATTVTDGTVVWTAVNPDGQAMRLSPIPPQSGMAWQVCPVGQQRIVQFTSLDQSLGVIPDDYFQYFVDGFMAECYRRNPDPKVRARYKDDWAIWLKSLSDAVKQGSREMDDFGFLPGSIMDNGAGSVFYGPAAPYPGYPWYY